MAESNLHSYGRYDKATEMIIAVTYNALFYNVGIDCDPVSLREGCPSQRTIAQAKLNFETDCLLKVMQEVKDDGAKKVNIITDHGHQGGKDHFVIVICWAGLYANRRRTIKHFCPSIDRAGHTTKQAADKVKNVLD